MLRKYVTSMTQQTYEVCGEQMLRSFVKYWPKGDIFVYTESGSLPFKDPRVHYKDLLSIPGLQYYLDAVSRIPAFSGQIDGRYDYRRNVNGFCRKSFAQIAESLGWRGHLFWIDSDVITSKHIPGVILDGFMQGQFIALMRRKTWHACTSFVGWDCGHAFSNAWFQMYERFYREGLVFLLPSWEDCTVVETLCNDLAGVRDIAEHITGDGPYNVFDDVFKGYAKHLKGGLKHAPKNRYEELIRIVAETKPKRLIEIGTWNGSRAIEFSKASPGLEYIGLDLFETASDVTDEKEKNVKKHHSVESVSAKLSEAGVKCQLYRGDSKETMAKYLGDYGRNSADLIYIDGGHSVETIASDLENSLSAIKPGGLIVMDDYYTEMPEEEMQRFGAQAVLKDIPHMVVPIKDPVVGGGFTQLAVVQC